MIQTAEGALSETQDILQRMRELATQAANDTNTTEDRGEIQKEINQLTSEINRIGNTTEFNTQKLLDGGKATKTNVPVEATTPGVAGGVATGDVSAITPGNNSVAEELGEYSFTIDTAFVTGDTLKIDNFTAITFTDTTGNIDTTSKISKADQAAALANYINTQTGSGLVGEKYTASVDEDDDTKVILKQNDGFGTSTAATAVKTGTGVVSTVNVDKAGVAEDLGDFTFDIDTAFEAGETIEIAGVKFTAVASGATASDGEFNIGSGESDQVTSLKAAIDASSLATRFDTSATSGTTISLVEKAGQATGTDLVDADIKLSDGKAKAGNYNFDVGTLEAGQSIKIDSTTISVFETQAEVDTANATTAGSAILEGTSPSDTAAKLKAAIDANATLSAKYDTTGSSAENLVLKQKLGNESSTAPTVEISTPAGSGFNASFQIGANTGQSFGIEINDMRSVALEVSNTNQTAPKTVEVDGKEYTVAWNKDQEVTNGTDSTGAEYALDVSTHDNATAAIKVIDDAINSVSAERSKLGAYQNRLDHTINNLSASSENLTAAESRIRDVDYALAA